MSKSDWNKVSELLDTLLSLSKQERADYLQTHHSGEPDLMREVEELLVSIERSEKEGFMIDKHKDHEALLNDFDAFTAARGPVKKAVIGKRVGPYEIVSVLGEGGMGSVYKAIRKDGAFSQTVAIKFINTRGFDPAVTERFRTEQQILADLKHPNIAALYDGGITDDGFPYFIMEYVEGIPVDEYATTKELKVNERLSLFKDLISAIDYAHSNLIIHRDLKPSNILVDNNGVLKVLDFGIAKILDEHQEKNMVLTRTGERVWTPSYAAPEQILERFSRIQTDVYGLGALLFRLLSGTTPFDFADKSMHEVESMILNEQPRTLKDVISEMGADTWNQASGTPDSEILMVLNDDLNAIIDKTLRKEPQERYNSARELLEDIERLEHNLPVRAVQGSFSYKSKKFIKRHQRALAVGISFILLLTFIVTNYTIQLSKEQQISATEARKATEVKELLIGLFENTDPLSGEDDVLDTRTLLEAGTEEILQRTMDPEIRSEMFHTLADIHQNLTEYQTALELSERALAHNLEYFDSLSVPSVRNFLQLGSIHFDLADYEKSEAYIDLSANLADRFLDPEHPLWIRIGILSGDMDLESAKGTEALNHYEYAMQTLLTQTEVDSASFIELNRKMGRTHYAMRNIADADSLFSLTLQDAGSFYGNDHILTSTVMDEAGVFYMTQGLYDRARTLFQDALSIKKEKHQGNAHPNILSVLNNLAVLEDYSENYPVADSLYEVTLEMDTEIYGEDHPYIANTKGHWANMHIRLQNYDRAALLLEDVLRIYYKTYDEQHPSLGRTYKQLGEVASANGAFDEADTYFSLSGDIYSNIVDSTSRTFAELSMAQADNNAARKEYLLAAKQYDLAIEGFRRLMDIDYFFWMEAECRLKQARTLFLGGQTDRAKQIASEFENYMDTTKALSDDETIQSMYSELSKLVQE